MVTTEYGDLHRYLLRTVASLGVISLNEAEKLLTDLYADQTFSIADLVKQINEQIKPLKQSIKITNDEYTSEEVIIFLSLGYDEATKSQNLFSQSELEYFRILLEQIMNTEGRQITGIHALNLVGSMKSSYTKTDAQKLLDTWCRMRYLDKEENNYALGVRTIHEFEGYFRENMPDTIEECCLCKQIVFRGYNCIGCAKAVHTRCLNKYLEKVSKWPCCKIDFSPEHLERLVCQSSRFTQSQRSTEHEAEVSTEAADKSDELTQEISSQDIIPEISQRITRKRKRHNE
ncbi:non-structural maintenance of chromosomes element 1 homolog [Colias croceus]|uniref:non-structural maintenance of chromosomes element 1 homolog n=1 Tax=Colias crocea TaxID=72248 RepID=UPI001E27EA92|nr:non-structural maintenance of chromosomes element 1 homolog [Colias croceus]